MAIIKDKVEFFLFRFRLIVLSNTYSYSTEVERELLLKINNVDSLLFKYRIIIHQPYYDIIIVFKGLFYIQNNTCNILTPAKLSK